MSNGKLIFISDLEGCANSFFNKKQSIAICSTEFFNALDNFLLINEFNKVAFLGDYFDKGDFFCRNYCRNY
jgi:hypothetical protein